ncbi:hypothetical protein DPMN_157221 [Dreissena polymorpha]|uniref:Uncharacterized protein n=1 Tax=Dreissena polymorpha TaxID=45954 RepID=A0A9D4IPT2_DREPO|nr:hypothetical protein DPMN_157221 [Dreissena polymorpha]
MLNQNFGWAWSMLAGLEIDRIVIRDVQYHFEVNLRRNKEVNVKKMASARVFPHRMFDPGGAPGLVMGPCIVEIDRIVIRDVQYQFEFQGSSAYSVGGDNGQDGPTDRRRR